MTNITELAQSLKAAAEKASDGDWVKESGDGWEAACSANDQANGGFIIAHFEGPDAAENREFVQAANPANIIALVEALEKAQTINAAAEKLVRCKGRYHSEQNYRALAALFGVKTPDLPPLEHENVHYADTAEMEIEALRQRIAELEREQEHLRPVGVRSVKASLRVENSKSRFIELWLRPGIFLPHKRPEHSMSYYAGMAVLTGTKAEIY